MFEPGGAAHPHHWSRWLRAQGTSVSGAFVPDSDPAACPITLHSWSASIHPALWRATGTTACTTMVHGPAKNHRRLEKCSQLTAGCLHPPSAMINTEERGLGAYESPCPTQKPASVPGSATLFLGKWMDKHLPKVCAILPSFSGWAGAGSWVGYCTLSQFVRIITCKGCRGCVREEAPAGTERHAERHAHGDPKACSNLIHAIAHTQQLIDNLLSEGPQFLQFDLLGLDNLCKGVGGGVALPGQSFDTFMERSLTSIAAGLAVVRGRQPQEANRQRLEDNQQHVQEHWAVFQGAVFKTQEVKNSGPYRASCTSRRCCCTHISVQAAHEGWSGESRPVPSVMSFALPAFVSRGRFTSPEKREMCGRKGESGLLVS